MNTYARMMAVLMAVILLDALVGYRVFRNIIHAGTGMYCKVTRRGWWEREKCTSSIFYSQALWVVISVIMGLMGGYVTMQALKTGKF